MALDPSDFGKYSGDLLVGNFGSGTIVAFDPVTLTAIDYLHDRDGTPVAIDGLWGLIFGNGAGLGRANALYFAAGPDDETEGLFGRTAAVPEPTTWAMTLADFGLAGVTLRRNRRSAAAPAYQRRPSVRTREVGQAAARRGATGGRAGPVTG